MSLSFGNNYHGIGRTIHPHLYTMKFQFAVVLFLGLLFPGANVVGESPTSEPDWKFILKAPQSDVAGKNAYYYIDANSIGMIDNSSLQGHILAEGSPAIMYKTKMEFDDDFLFAGELMEAIIDSRIALCGSNKEIFVERFVVTVSGMRKVQSNAVVLVLEDGTRSKSMQNYVCETHRE